jgi:hypothetical protein
MLPSVSAYLIELDEPNVLGSLSEALSANINLVFADDSLLVIAHLAFAATL